jgi:hypothetical protein
MTNGIVGGRVDVYDATAAKALGSYPFTDTAWKSGVLYFTAPAVSGHTLKVRLYHTAYNVVGGSAYFDDVKVRASPSAEPANWARWQATPATVYRSTQADDVHTGTAGLVVKTTGTIWRVAEQALASYIPGAAYRVDFYGKTNGLVGGRVDVLDVTARTVLGRQFFSKTFWEAGTFTFAAPSAAGHTLKLRCYTDTYTVNGGAVAFDDVSVKMLNETLVQDAQILFPFARFVSTVLDDPFLSEDPAYVQKAVDYYGALQAVLPKWFPYWKFLEGTVPQQSVFIGNALEDAGWYTGNSLPFNQFLDMGRVLLEFAYISGDYEAASMASTLGHTFRAHLYANGAVPSAVWWNFYEPLLPGDAVHFRAEDVSYANLDIGAALDLYYLGFVFTEEDMSAFTSTLLDAMADGSVSPPTIGRYVTGPTPVAPSLNLRDWTDLAEFDSRVWDLASAQMLAYLNARRADGLPLVDSGANFLALAKVAYWDPSLPCGCSR